MPSSTCLLPHRLLIQFHTDHSHPANSSGKTALQPQHTVQAHSDPAPALQCLLPGISRNALVHSSLLSSTSSRISVTWFCSATLVLQCTGIHGFPGPHSPYLRFRLSTHAVWKGCITACFVISLSRYYRKKSNKFVLLPTLNSNFSLLQKWHLTILYCTLLPATELTGFFLSLWGRVGFWLRPNITFLWLLPDQCLLPTQG